MGITGYNTTVIAGATTGGSFTGTDPKTFLATADDATVDAAAIAAFLNAGTGVVVDTGSSGLQAGDLTVSAAINKTAGGTARLTLTTAHDVLVNQQIAGTTLNLQVLADRDGDSSGAFTAGADITGNIIDITGATIAGTGTIRGVLVQLGARNGIGADATGFVSTAADTLAVNNTTASNVAIVEADSVALTSTFSNLAPSGALSLRTLNGSIDSGIAVSTNNGQITFRADSTGAGANLNTNINIGGGSITSAGGDIRLFAADTVFIAGDVNAGSGNVTFEANSANATESVADNFGAIGRSTAGTVLGNVVTFKAASGIGEYFRQMSTVASTIAATNTGAGDIFISETDDVNFSATNPGGDVQLQTGSGITTVAGPTSAARLTISSQGTGGIVNINAALSVAGQVELYSRHETNINVALNGIGALYTGLIGTTTINGGSVTTSDAQTYNNAITLGASTTLTSSGGGPIAVVDVHVAFDLAVNTAGAALFRGPISGAGAFTQSGSGTTTLAFTNLYTGATTVNAGTLLVNGSIVSATMVNSTATLGGTGHTAAVTVASGGTLSPGKSAGILSTGDVSLASGATFKVELGGTTAGSQYDQLNVAGGVTLSGATLDVRLIGGFLPTTGNSFTIISNDGTDGVNGTFAGLAEGARFSAGGRSFSITYHGGSNNNDVVLVAPPGSNDFNGDGNSDILWRNADGSVAEWQMNGRQVIANLGIAVPGNEWKFQDTGDLGGDGISDVIWRHTSGQVVLWQMNGKQIVSNTSILDVSNQYHIQGVADFNGDGKSDVLLRHDSGQVVLWQMNSDKIAANTAITALSRDYHIEGVGDFGGDGKNDVLLRHDNGQVVMWQMNGDQIAINTAVATVSQEYRVQGVGDFNGDGKSDVLWRHASGQFVLWQMDGDRIVSNTAILDVSNEYKVQDVRDYNGDGKSDILLRHDSGQVILWQMNGDKIASNTQVAIVPTDWQIQAHHFDLV